MAQEELHSRPSGATREGHRCLRVRPCHASWVFFFLFYFSRLAPMRLRLGLIRTESGQLRPYRLKPPIQAKIQKKKKVQNTPFELNIKPYFSSLHTNTPNFSSLPLSHSVTRLSLSVCSLPLSLLAMRHSASAELVTWLTSYFSYYLLLLLNLVYVCIIWKSMLSNILKI